MMCIAGHQQEANRAAVLVAQDVELGVLPPLWLCRYHEPKLHLCASGSAQDLDAAAIDKERATHAPDPGKLGEDALPNAAVGLASEQVQQRLIRSADLL